MQIIEWTSPPPERDQQEYKDGLRYLVNGEVKNWSGPGVDVMSPIHTKTPGGLQKRLIGKCPLLDVDVARQALSSAVKAYDQGRGKWPTASVAWRIQCLEAFLNLMEKQRLQVSKLITWEIAKSWGDSTKEFDRTVEYGRATIKALKEVTRTASQFVIDSGFMAQIRRSPFGVALCMGPYNYPLNEAFATLIPALIMGNTVVVKLPRLGMLCNMPLLEAFAESFPPGVINIITGEGSTVVTPIVESGEIDLLAFIGSARVANILKHKHPRSNRLRCVLGLGAKNPAIVLSDANLDLSVTECIQGSLSFNGQRCTALKIIFVERKIAEEFTNRLSEGVSKLVTGMPFQDKVFLTPLPENEAVQRMSDLVADAISKGAQIKNRSGGEKDLTYFHPAVLYPVSREMRVWHEEQFGPIVAIAPFDNPQEILEYVATSPYGQQASIFGNDPAVIGRLVDALVNQVSRVNLNCQCQRGPDTFPFAGRKDSAEGTLSVSDALRIFSIRTLVAARECPESTDMVQKIMKGKHSQFLNTDYLF